MEIQTKHQINEQLAWLTLTKAKIDMLEDIQEDLFNLFESDRIEQEDHDCMMEFTTEKAKKILKEDKNVFKN